MVKNKCKDCGVDFESEGHPNGTWLTICLNCNQRRKEQNDWEDKKICYNPECNKAIPESRLKQGRISCSKKCSNAWNWVPQKQREEIRGRKYNRCK